MRKNQKVIMGKFVYLDHNATTPTERRVVAAMTPYFNKLYGNPSSIYKFAQEAQEAKEVARVKVAKILMPNQKKLSLHQVGRRQIILQSRELLMLIKKEAII